MQNNYLLKKPKKHKSSVIFNCPHSGRDYRALSSISNINNFDLRSSEDFFVDELFENVNKFGSFFLNAKFPRAFVDLNRSHNEIDPKLFFSLPKSSYSLTKKVQSGLGVIPRVVSEGKEIYQSRLNYEEAKSRLRNFYFPYHAQLKKIIEFNLKKFGEVLIFDCHSMPHSSLSNIVCNEEDKPDIVLGDCYGTSCKKEIFDLVNQIFVNNGFKVNLNIPFCGGYITKHYGNPRKNINSIQIEINRKFYMNEENQLKLKDFEIKKEKFKIISEELSKISIVDNSIQQAAE